jgi:hypothetical protein
LSRCQASSRSRCGAEHLVYAALFLRELFLRELFLLEPFLLEPFLLEPFLLEPFLLELFLLEPFLAGTFFPAARASESPMAMACLRLFTFFLERPDRNVPVFRSCITFLTVEPTLRPYLRAFFLLAMVLHPEWLPDCGAVTDERLLSKLCCSTFACFKCASTRGLSSSKYAFSSGLFTLGSNLSLMVSSTF